MSTPCSPPGAVWAPGGRLLPRYLPPPAQEDCLANTRTLLIIRTRCEPSLQLDPDSGQSADGPQTADLSYSSFRQSHFYLGSGTKAQCDRA